MHQPRYLKLIPEGSISQPDTMAQPHTLWPCRVREREGPHDLTLSTSVLESQAELWWPNVIMGWERSERSTNFTVETGFKIECSKVHTVTGEEVTEVHNVTTGKKRGEAFPGIWEHLSLWTGAHVLPCDTACTWHRLITDSSSVLLLSMCLTSFSQVGHKWPMVWAVFLYLAQWPGMTPYNQIPGTT